MCSSKFLYRIESKRERERVRERESCSRNALKSSRERERVYLTDETSCV